MKENNIILDVCKYHPTLTYENIEKIFSKYIDIKNLNNHNMYEIIESGTYNKIKKEIEFIEQCIKINKG